MLSNPSGVKSCKLVAYEVEPLFLPLLEQCLSESCALLNSAGISATHDLRDTSFLSSEIPKAPSLLVKYTHCILNPPYRKLRSESDESRVLARAGINTSNLYSVFVWLAMLQLESLGELAAITPRSFCNGPYFRGFRKALLSNMALDKIHVFDSRTAAFADDNVEQENLIFHAVRDTKAPEAVEIVRREALGKDQPTVVNVVPFTDVVHPDDPEQYIRLVTDDLNGAFRRYIETFPASLNDIGIEVSTGPIVDFRLEEWLRSTPDDSTVPLIFPEAIRCWPSFVATGLSKESTSNCQVG